MHASGAPIPQISNGAHTALRGFLANVRLGEVRGVALRHVYGWECEYFFIFHQIISKQINMQVYSQI